MQVLDDEKRRRIQSAAARMFASRHFHEVRLDDIAAEAGVGKGTVYTYFKSKEDLHLAILFDGFVALVDGLKSELEDDSKTPADGIEAIVRGIADYAYAHPHVFGLMRTLEARGTKPPKWIAKRNELLGLIERVIRRGIKSGEWHDPHPEWTANYVPAMVRSVLLFGTPPKNAETLVRHTVQLLLNGLQKHA
ncbi:MAG: TetR/AcrR family transcriptional regulator [Planctomycetes bacterium]|nr:TetR/AcrR family transcriptional regulator [Planctomycetota bacterium]